MTETIDPNLKKAEDLFHLLLWGPILEAQLAAMFVANPWMNLPIVKQIITGLVHLFSDKLYTSLVMFVDLQAVTILNEAHQKAFVRADIELMVIAHSKGVNSDEYKACREKAKALFVSYTTSIGS